MRKFYSIDDKLEAHPNIKNITACLDRLCASDTIDRLPGNCISACDIIQNMLSFYDTQSKIIECQAMVIKENEAVKDFCFVGFNNVNVTNNTVDSHVVVVTNTEPPVLIDAAVGHLLPKDEQIVVKVLDNLDPTIIGEFKIRDLTLTYHHKKNIRLPNLHQKTLIERFRDEQELRNKVSNLQKFLYILLGIAVYNFFANNILIILKMMFP